jgi:hypothetical protein
MNGDAPNATQQPPLQPQSQPEQPHEWQLQNTPTTVAPTPVAQPAQDGISWTASEFIAHQKTPTWYLGFAGLAILIIVGVFFLVHDLFSRVMIVAVMVLFGFIGGRPPRTLQYSLNDEGLSVGRNFYPYSLFKSFSVGQEGPFVNIMIMPLRRVMPPVTAYVTPDQEEKILAVLSQHLPIEAQHLDILDRFMRRVKL